MMNTEYKKRANPSAALSPTLSTLIDLNLLVEKLFRAQGRVDKLEDWFAKLLEAETIVSAFLDPRCGELLAQTQIACSAISTTLQGHRDAVLANRDRVHVTPIAFESSPLAPNYGPVQSVCDGVLVSNQSTDVQLAETANPYIRLDFGSNIPVASVIVALSDAFIDSSSTVAVLFATEPVPDLGQAKVGVNGVLGIEYRSTDSQRLLTIRAPKPEDSQQSTITDSALSQMMGLFDDDAPTAPSSQPTQQQPAAASSAPRVNAFLSAMSGRAAPPARPPAPPSAFVPPPPEEVSAPPQNAFLSAMSGRAAPSSSSSRAPPRAPPSDEVSASPRNSLLDAIRRARRPDPESAEPSSSSASSASQRREDDRVVLARYIYVFSPNRSTLTLTQIGVRCNSSPAQLQPPLQQIALNHQSVQRVLSSVTLSQIQDCSAALNRFELNGSQPRQHADRIKSSEIFASPPAMPTSHGYHLAQLSKSMIQVVVACVHVLQDTLQTILPVISGGGSNSSSIGANSGFSQLVEKSKSMLLWSYKKDALQKALQSTVSNNAACPTINIDTIRARLHADAGTCDVQVKDTWFGQIRSELSRSSPDNFKITPGNRAWRVNALQMRATDAGGLSFFWRERSFGLYFLYCSLLFFLLQAPSVSRSN